eukprot:SAG31_NODE_24637_length_477_cov_0.962963_1_plen_77_part_10
MPRGHDESLANPTAGYTCTALMGMGGAPSFLSSTNKHKFYNSWTLSIDPPPHYDTAFKRFARLRSFAISGRFPHNPI